MGLEWTARDGGAFLDLSATGAEGAGLWLAVRPHAEEGYWRPVCRLVRGEDALTLYQWNTRIAEHYFCRHCGIYTHHQPRTRPDMIAVNVGCIDSVNTRQIPLEFAEGSKLSGSR